MASCLYCSLGDKLVTMLLIGMWLEIWGVRMQGLDSISEGTCCPKYMAIRTLMRLNKYRLWR